MSTPRRGHRTTFPVIVWALAAAALLIIRFIPELERNFQAWLTVLVLLLGVALTLLWFLFLSRFGVLLRLGGAAILALAGFLAPRILRVDGTTNGTGLPRIAWRGGGIPRAVPLAPPTVPIPTTAPGNFAISGDSPQFLGARRDGAVTGAGLANSWAASPPRELWRHAVGGGWSAFAVSGTIAVTQEQVGDSELVTAYDAGRGNLLWAHTNHVRFFEWQGGEGPRATPTIVDGRVHTYGATGILDCLELADGRPVWSRPVLTGLPNLTWGVSCSPLVLEDSVVVTGGAVHGPTLLAFRRGNGEEIWRAGLDAAGYSSPVAAVLAGRRLILSVNAGSLTIHDPATGTVLLDFPWSDGKRPIASQPLVIGTNRVFLSAGYGIGCVMLEVKVKAGADGRLEASEVWRNKMMKTQFNSAVYRDGHLYGLDDGFLACVNAETGRRLWKDGRYGSGQTLLVDDLVLIQTEPGAVVLAAARPGGFEELGRIPALDTKTWNYPTLAGRLLLVRNDRQAAGYELPGSR